MIRISAGRWKGRKLDVPLSARPTASRAREALFDLLGPGIDGARVLDLYAGSGAVGIEAVSRGAARAVLVEREAEALEKNVARLGDPGELVVMRRSAQESIRELLARGERFEIVFSDPPYDDEPRVPPAVADLIADGGVLVLQCDAGGRPADAPGLRVEDVRAYGRNRFAFYRRISAGGKGHRTTR